MDGELRDKHGQKRDEALGADGVGGQPGNDQRLLDGRAIAGCPGTGGDREGQLWLGEEPNSVRFARFVETYSNIGVPDSLYLAAANRWPNRLGG